ncbi:MAG: hypothetical protein JW801_02915 [Bacteroidales bacterium]|nr:hypothetical protein [Bacteroidales bacterium]
MADYKLVVIILSLLSTVCSPELTGQESDHKTAEEYLSERGEVYFRFSRKSVDLSLITRMVSIDRISSDSVYAYANKSEFESFLAMKRNYHVLSPAGYSLEKNAPATENIFSESWNVYPAYEEYLDYMLEMSATYPDLCRLDTIGKSVEGRLLLCLKISDYPENDEAEPEFLFTSTIHGDEVTGFMLCLHLIDTLLQQYSSNPEIKELVDTCEIFINPNANPDGTYAAGNSTVYGAVRSNANGYDLNRNFPDPQYGDNPNGAPYQPETLVMMEYLKKHTFVLSANYHGGAEVINYPWDTWPESHPDDDWFSHISFEYADTVKRYAGASYFSDVIETGVIMGYDWYPIAGGRQDYVTYFLHGREITIEVSESKMPDPAAIPHYWNWNKAAMLNYIRQCTYGLHGIVTDAVTSEPLKAEIIVINHDAAQSYVLSDPLNGEFHRLIAPGTYRLCFKKDGYLNEYLDNVILSDYGVSEWMEVQLKPGIEMVPQPKANSFSLQWSERDQVLYLNTSLPSAIRICIWNSLGQLVVDTGEKSYSEGVHPLAQTSYLQQGIYFSTVFCGNERVKSFQFSKGF